MAQCFSALLRYSTFWIDIPTIGSVLFENNCYICCSYHAKWNGVGDRWNKMKRLVKISIVVAMLILGVAAVVGWGDGGNKVGSCDTTATCSTLSADNAARNYTFESHTRSAVLPHNHLSLSLPSLSVKTTSLRQRWHAGSWQMECCATCWHNRRSDEYGLCGDGKIVGITRAADYFIFALRHIII